MKITFFLLISLKCVRTHTLVYSLKHIFRIRVWGHQELKELMGKIKKSCAEEAQDFVYGGIDLFLNPFSIGVPTLEHNLEFEH